MYELLLDYIKLKEINLGVQEFRTVMGVPDRSYQMFAMLEERVLKPATETISDNTDIKVSYEVHRIGRKVTGLTLKPDRKKSKKRQQLLEDSELVKKLQYFGISDDRIQKIIAKHTKEYIYGNISAVEEELRR